jgi:multisubunit Na+/H+ antiporter MnhG subunit
MSGRRPWQILALMIMSLVGVGFGVWLSRAGFIALGCLFIGVFLCGAPFASWFIAPSSVPSSITPSMSSWWQRLLLLIACLLGAAVCGVGVYLWRVRPEEWQAGLVFILFGLLVLAPVTMWEVQLRGKNTSTTD